MDPAVTNEIHLKLLAPRLSLFYLPVRLWNLAVPLIAIRRTKARNKWRIISTTSIEKKCTSGVKPMADVSACNYLGGNDS